MRRLNLDAIKFPKLFLGLKSSVGGAAQQNSSFGDVRCRVAAVIGSVIFALLLALLLSLFVAGFADEHNIRAQKELSAIIANRPQGVFNSDFRKHSDGVLNFSAFNVRSDVGKKAEPDKNLDSVKLVGTLPGVGAWVQYDGSVQLLLKKQELSGYILELIDPGRILLSKNGEFFPLYLNYIEPPAKKEEPKPSGGAPGGTPDKKTSSGISMAAFNGADGTITREMLDELLMNPYGEIAKVRLVPMEGGSGMTVLSMQGDSLLGQMGIKTGDTLTGINGVPIKDITNLSNAINSMLSGARLDFQILRDKAPGKLGYVVQ